MTSLARHAGLLLTLSLLTSAATIHAECAWVLWVRASPTVNGNIVGAWTPKIKAAFEATGLVLKQGQSADIRWQCLPDTVDPRGPKGK